MGANLSGLSIKQTSNRQKIKNELDNKLKSSCKNVGTAVNSLDCSKGGGALIMNNSSISQETHLTQSCALDGITQTLQDMAVAQNGDENQNADGKGTFNLSLIGIDSTTSDSDVRKKVKSAVDNEIGSKLKSINKITADACALNNSKIEQAHTAVMDAVLNASFINKDTLDTKQSGVMKYMNPVVAGITALGCVLVFIVMIIIGGQTAQKVGPQMMASRKGVSRNIEMATMAAAKNVRKPLKK